MTHDTLEYLRDLLSRERSALLAGRYDQLDDIAARKLDLLTSLAAKPPGREELVDLRDRLQSNQALTEAALGGVKAAKARIDALLSVETALTTYGRDGNLAVRTTPESRIEKKA